MLSATIDKTQKTPQAYALLSYLSSSKTNPKPEIVIVIKGITSNPLRIML